MQTAAAKQIGFDRLLAHFVQRQVGFRRAHPLLLPLPASSEASTIAVMVEHFWHTEDCGMDSVNMCRKSMPERKSSVVHSQTVDQVGDGLVGMPPAVLWSN